MHTEKDLLQAVQASNYLIGKKFEKLLTSGKIYFLKNLLLCYSAFNFSFHKICLILTEWFLTRFPPNFQERFLMSSASPEFVFLGSKDKTVLF